MVTNKKIKLNSIEKLNSVVKHSLFPQIRLGMIGFCMEDTELNIPLSLCYMGCFGQGLFTFAKLMDVV